MYYSVKELKEKLSERILGLGIDSKYLENPAFSSAISKIEGMIDQMNMFEKADKVSVREEKGKISFNWISSVDVKYSMTISSSNSETFTCITTKEDKPYMSDDRQYIRSKDVIEQVVTMDKVGAITIITNDSTVDTINCKQGKCNNITSALREYYTPDGVMQEKEYKGYAPFVVFGYDFDRVNVDVMLLQPRDAFKSFGKYNDYQSWEFLQRDKLDTARFISEDKSRGIKYNAMRLLNQEHGLRDMFLEGGFSNTYAPEVVINPLSQEEIEKMIQNEGNSKVAEGLRKRAVGRDTYSYNSTQDHDFICRRVSNVVADNLVQAMADGVVDVNGQPIVKGSYYENNNTRTMGFGTFSLITICSIVASFVILVLGILLTR